MLGAAPMIRHSLLLVCLLAVGCGQESSLLSIGASSETNPAIHFITTDTEVTRVFLPEQVHVQLSGFAAASRVTLRASITGYESRADFLTDAAGSLDVASQAPLDGTYEGADADGLFWSMVTTGATAASPGADSSDVTVEAEVDGRVVTRATLARYAVADGLVETTVHDDGLVGVLVTPAAPGPHPALLIFGGSEGGIDYGHRNARHYASLGYSCLGVAYFNAEKLPPYLEDLPLEYFGKALSWMKSRPEVKADAIGVVGASRGGELALLLGATFPEVKAVVANVPSGVVWSGWNPEWPERAASSWTFGGDELSYMPNTDAPPLWNMDEAGRTVEHGTPMFDAALDAASPAELEAAAIRVEKVNGPVLMLAAGDDQMWPSCRLAELAMKRLTAAGHTAKFADDLVCYPGAGHYLGAPGRPTTDPSLIRSDRHIWIALGGMPAGIAHAQRDAFERRRAFLAKALR